MGLASPPENDRFTVERCP